MRKISLCWISLFVVIFIGKAQSAKKITICGELIDKISHQPIPHASVRLLTTDSVFISGVASDNDGRFELSGKTGKHILHVSYVGYMDVFKDINVSASNPRVSLGKIQMSENSIMLSEAVIKAKAAEITVKGDTVEYNADSYKIAESAVLEDLFKKMPGVEIDQNGKITINGREVKKIMVEGEEFFGKDPKVASKNLPAKMVDKLQVLDRKSDLALMTGFDDGDEETVINLRLRPGMKEGLMGNAFAGYGSRQRYEANGMMNYMKEKNQFSLLAGINNTNNAGFSDLSSSTFGPMGGGRARRGMGGQPGISTSANAGLNFSTPLSSTFKWGGNVAYGSIDNHSIVKEHTQNMLSKGNTFENENNIGNNISHNFNVDLRMEWEPDSSTKVIFTPNVSIYKNRKAETGDFITTDEENETINHGASKYDSDGRGKNMNARLDVSRQLGKQGRVLSMQLLGGMNDAENSGNNLSNTLYGGTRPDDSIDQQFVNTDNSKNWRGYLSYVEPIGKNNFIQLAYNYRQNISNSDRDTRNKDDAGNYTVLDSVYSKRLENNFINQEIELNVKVVREKYDYTVGFSLQPSRSSSQTFIGEKSLHDLQQQVMNYSPKAQFNYSWSRRHNLRIHYFGDTRQPGVLQLSPVVDASNPLNITYGNPDLKPSFEHRLNIRYQRFDPEKNRAVMFFARAGYLTNDIVSSTFTDRATGRKETTYENVKGNRNANARAIFNTPLKNIKFSVFSMSFVGYNHTNGFSNGEPNLNKRLNLMQALGMNYRSDMFDFSIRGNVGYNAVKNSLKGQRDQEYFNYRSMANTTLRLPFDFSIESDISYATNSGYADGYKQNEWLWNASIQKQLFKQKNGTLRFKIYDILQQRSNITRSVTSNYIRDTTTNTLTSYFMMHFVYRFNIFKGGAKREDMESPHRRRGQF